MRQAGAAAVADARNSGKWNTPLRTQMPRTPEELTRALARSEAARKRFEAMPPSHRRNYQRWIAEAVKPETRARRAALAIAHLATGKTNPWAS